MRNASAPHALAHDRFKRGKRAIGRADAAELPVDHDRMRLLDDELAVVDIRLGDDRHGLAGLAKRTPHAVVEEA